MSSLTALLSDDANADGVVLDDKRICHMLEAGMLPDLSHRYTKDTTAPKITDDKLDEWLRAVIVINKVCQYKDELMAFFVFNANADKSAAKKGKYKAADTGDECNSKNPSTTASCHFY
ncbi:hypothetical protein B0H17DRAFT_1150527 [Mycena rosella]|uniref:Uncharacterized protein n=1 Tax=Mycena rosella TaxID=1033263 RepID=A0AAD7BT19_MYCRO|nr:hypothetical protein B0H17DRAFT_1150527 [Mycena rosella]